MRSIPVERLRERLYFDDLGILRWRRCASMPKQWNSVWPGREAFTAIDGKGYRHGSIDGCYVRLHRVVWALAYGSWPAGDLDHVNGDRLDNRLDNLREVCGSANQRNAKRRADNTSGATGVSWYKPTGRWRATVCLQGRNTHLGYFDNFEDALAARRKADVEFLFHANHGAR